MSATRKTAGKKSEKRTGKSPAKVGRQARKPVAPTGKKGVKPQKTVKAKKAIVKAKPAKKVEKNAAVKKAPSKKAPVAKTAAKKPPAKKAAVKKPAQVKKPVKKTANAPAVKKTDTGKKTPAARGKVSTKKVERPSGGLSPLLGPKNIAIVGASEAEKSPSRLIIENILASGYHGKLFPISAKKTILDLKAYSSIRKVPEKVDLVICPTGADITRNLLQECGRAKVKTIVLCGPAYGDKGRKAMDDIRKMVAKYKFRILGPESLGLASAGDKLQFNATRFAWFTPSGNAGLFTDTNSVVEAIFNLANSRGLEFGKFVSLGGKWDITEDELLEYAAADPSLRYIMLCLSEFADVLTFLNICKKLAKEKPVAVLNVGKPMPVEPVAKGILANIADPLLPGKLVQEESGVIPCTGLDDFVTIGIALDKMPVPQGKGVGIVANGSGPGNVTSNLCIQYNLEINPLSPKSLGNLTKSLPKDAQKTNPIIVPAKSGVKGYWDSLQALAREQTIDIIIPVFVPSQGIDDIEAAKAIAKTWREMKSKRKFPKPVLPIWMTGRISDEDEAVGILKTAGLPVYSYPAEAVRAAEGMAKYGKWRSKPEGTVTAFEVDIERANKIIGKAVSEKREYLTDSEAQMLMESYGIPVVTTVVTGSLIAAKKHAAKMGYPLAVKGTSEGLINKSEMKVVHLDVPSERELVNAYQKIDTILKRKWEKPYRIMMQPMIAEGIDLAVSSLRFHGYPPLLMLGLGGGLVKAANSFGLIPLSDADVHMMVHDSTAYPLFKGSAKKEGIDIPGLEEILIRFSQLMNTHKEIVEIDLDPLRAFQGGEFVVIDQVIRISG